MLDINSNEKTQYNIVLEDNSKLVLASCPTLEFAENYLKEMFKTDKQLAKYYNWNKIPKYKIIKKREKEV